jgi:PleD family two-component response regulator
MSALTNMRVLIAEDDFASRILLEAILEKWGYEVVVANDGADAWRILDADNAPSIAVLDWMMPHLSGLELCERVRQRDQELAPYIVMLTTKSEKADVSAGLDAGADDYLVKPFDFTELGARLRVAKRAVVLQRDLIESRKAVHYQALHDTSTGALNRGAILSELSQRLSASTPAVIGLFAIDEHKWLLQHESADAAEAAVRGLVHELRVQCPEALIGRYCADQLLVVWPEQDTDAVADAVAITRIRLRDFGMAGSGKLATFSCGLTHSEPTPSLELALCYADSALYAARAFGNATEIFSLELSSIVE